MKKLLAGLGVFVLTCSQLTLAQTTEPPTTVKDPAHIPARGGEVDWGLALSGGGMRAASFSIGVLKALYDKRVNGKRLLDQIDVISSISGGGFANYWLLTNYATNKNLPFGAAALDDLVFLRNTCSLQETSNFITLAAVPKYFQKSPTAVRYYQERIQRSFGNPRSADELDSRLVSFLDSSITTGDAPYFILNAALAVQTGQPGERLVEITDEYVGSPTIKFAPWKPDKTWGLLESIAISAAATKKLFRTMPSDPDLQLPDKNFVLIDAGLVENLAAVPLIRRGINNIIIVDSSEDPQYQFGSYTILREILESMNITLRIKEIDDFLDAKVDATKAKDPYTGSAVSKGSATTTFVNGEDQIDSTIYYIKLSRPASILLGDQTPEFQTGRVLAAARDTAIDCKHCDYRCMDAPPLTAAHSLYVYLVNDYNRHREQKWRLAPWAVWRFPQIRTWDQSPKRDTMEALIGLGYLQASELNP